MSLEAPVLSSPISHVLWQASISKPVVTRVAVCGDFLPSGDVPRGADVNWNDLATPLAPYFAGVDATFANLECPLEVDGLKARPLEGMGQIVSAPRAVLGFLQAIRCKAASLANNHACDFGAEGVARTRAALVGNGMRPLGMARGLTNPPEVFVWHAASGLRVGFWAAARAAHDFATLKSSGVEPATAARAAQAIAELRARRVDFAIALIHAGCIRASRPAPEDVSVLRDLAKSGFDVVAASHSHRIAGAEILQSPGRDPAFCFHGLGSIVSGYVASPIERDGLVVVAGFDGAAILQEISVHPVQLSENGIGAVPSFPAADAILHRFSALSSEIRDDSYKSAFYREISRGLAGVYLRDVRSAFRQSGIRGLTRKASRLRLHHVTRLAHGVFAK